MTTFFSIIFRQQIFTVNFDIIFRLVKKIICRKTTAFFAINRHKTTVFFAKTIQILTNFYRFLQNFTNFFRQKLRQLINKQSQEFTVEICRKILSNYYSTTFFASVFRQEFSPRFFDSKFRQPLTNFASNRQIFCRLLQNFVENYCRKILSKLDNIFRQDFSPSIDGI